MLKRGDRVKCINYHLIRGLNPNVIYTVGHVSFTGMSVWIKGFGDQPFYQQRFRLVKDEPLAIKKTQVIKTKYTSNKFSVINDSNKRIVINHEKPAGWTCVTIVSEELDELLGILQQIKKELNDA